MTDIPTGRLPSLNALRIFEVAARHLSFRAAADELGVTQGAVAQQIRGLEAELGIRLFDRLPRTLALTGEGRVYVADIRRALAIIAEATQQLRPQPLSLTISVTPSFASKWLIPRLPDFTARYPDLDLHLQASERLSTFQADGVDLAVRYGRPPFGQGLAVDLLFEQEIIAVCSPRLLQGIAPPKRAADLAGFTLLHDTNNFWPEFIERHLGGTAEMNFRGISFSQTVHALEAAMAGQGIALANRFFVRRDIEEGRLQRLHDGTLRTRADFFLVRPRYRKSEAVDRVAAWMLEEVARDNAARP